MFIGREEELAVLEQTYHKPGFQMNQNKNGSLRPFFGKVNHVIVETENANI